MILYGLSACDTCRKALAALKKAGRNAHLHDLRRDGLPEETAARFHAAFGDAVLNRRSTTWRLLSASERARDPLDLIAAHPALMKRPVIEEEGGRLHLGWGPEVRAALLP